MKKDGWMWVAYCNYHLQLSPFVCRPLYSSVAVGLSAGRSQGSNKIAIILKIFVDVDHLK